MNLKFTININVQISKDYPKYTAPLKCNGPFKRNAPWKVMITLTWEAQKIPGSHIATPEEI